MKLSKLLNRENLTRKIPRIISRYFAISACVLMVSLAKASAPVEEIGAMPPPMSSSEEATTYPASDNPPANYSTNNSSYSSNQSDAQRLNRVEQQMNNLTSMNLPQQLSDLQQQMQQLNGQLQEMQHELKSLTEQQGTYYQDLDARLNHLKTNSPMVGTPAASVAKSVPMTPDAKLKESDEYQAAVNLLMKKDYNKAGPAFKGYLAHYPQGSYIANAYYWLGEVNLMKNSLSQAASNFQTVISTYPKSDKIADARLKLALVHAQQGNTQMAKAELKKIKSDYPGSTIAQLATIQLQQLDSGALNSN